MVPTSMRKLTYFHAIDASLAQVFPTSLSSDNNQGGGKAFGERSVSMFYETGAPSRSKVCLWVAEMIIQDSLATQNWQTVNSVELHSSGVTTRGKEVATDFLVVNITLSPTLPFKTDE